MTIRKEVSRAIQRGRGRAASLEAQRITDIAIPAFLEAAARQGWHMQPDEATEEMAGVVMVGTEKFIYRAMLAAAPEFEWDK